MTSNLDLNASYDIVISFGAAEGGAVCAGWLRDEIHKSLSIAKDKIYFDTLTLHDKVGTTPQKKGVTSGAIAPINPYWQLYYQAAMGKAKWMIFIITEEWLASPYCQREFEWFLAHLKANSGLKGMAIFLDDLHLKKHICNKFFDHVKVRIPGKRKHLLADHQKARVNSGYEKQWTLDDDSRNAVVLALG